MARSRAVPVQIGFDNVRTELERIQLGNGLFSEGWLQKLIHDHPTILPISDIEPGFGELIAAAREVPCAHGNIDNLYLTPSGDIVLVETKLWRNSEIRREVVAQALDYVAALTGMSYNSFEAAVCKGQHAPRKLYELFAEQPDVLDEPEFFDAVSLNLQRGRMLVMVVGDGIRAETEALAHLLQSHAGSHFTFALVEIAAWRNVITKDILMVPTTLAHTVMIERGIVRLVQGVMTVEPTPKAAQPKAQSISMEEFLEAMAKRAINLPDAINAFITALEPYGVYPELKAALTIKTFIPECDKPVGFGHIERNGQFWPHLPSWVPEHIWKPYFLTIAKMVGGELIIKPGVRNVAVSKHAAPRIDQLLPSHHDEMVAAIAQVIEQLRLEGAKPPPLVILADAQ
jgi:hypothetical protein